MKTIFKGLFQSIGVLGIVMGLVASMPVLASAQTYYSNSYNSGYYNGYNTYPNIYQSSVCVVLSNNLQIGSRDSYTNGDVSRLQQFLNQYGYLRTGLVTGYFGNATRSAVMRFQQQYDLPADGAIGPVTRNVIQQVSCGNTGYNYNNNYYNNNNNGCPPGYYYNIYTGVPCNNYNNYYPSSLSITSVNGPTNVTVGNQNTWTIMLNNPSNSYVTTSVTWGDENTYGYGAYNSYSPQSNYVYGQQTLSFTHTYNVPGYYTITFTARDNNGGTVTGTASVNVTGQYSPYPYQTLSMISPNQARIGTQVTLYGSGFSPTNNTVHFGNGGSVNVPSYSNGTIIYYTIPSFVSACDLTNYYYGQMCGAPVMQVTPGNYTVYVSSSNGGTTNSLNFIVTP